MTTSAIETSEHVDEGGLHRLAWWFAGCGIVGLAMVMNPLMFGFFDAETDAELLKYVRDHLGALRALFTGLGVIELLLGIGLWRWGSAVGRCTPARRGTVANVIAGIALVAGAAGLVSRLIIWFENAEQVADDQMPVLELVAFPVFAVGMSVSFLVFGYLMIRGAMPIWLGIVWVICGLMFWLGILPLWFYFGAAVFGIRGVVRFRDGRDGADQIAGVRRPDPGEMELSS